MQLKLETNLPVIFNSFSNRHCMYRLLGVEKATRKTKSIGVS